MLSRQTRNSLVQIGVLRAPESVVNHGLGIGTRNAELGQAGGSVPWSGSRSPPTALAQHGRTDGRGRMLSARESEINKPAASLSAQAHTHTHTEAVGRAGGGEAGPGLMIFSLCECVTE
jgi:hypothetical protein